jgi:hypothetical protein
MTTSTRYAALDPYFGYVWGAAYAASPEAAAVAITTEADGSRTYQAEPVSVSDRARATYLMYAVPDALEITDGQCPQQAAEVQAGERMGYVRVWDTATEL